MTQAHPKEQLQGKDRVFSRVGRTIIFFVGGLAIAGSVFIAQTCDFLQMTNVNDAPSDSLPAPWNVASQDETLKIGLFGYATQDDCQRYKNNFSGDWDIFVYMAQYAAIVAPILALVAWIGSVGECLFWSTTKPTNCCYRGYVVVAVFWLVAGAAQCFTFLLYLQSGFCAFDANQECEMGRGGKIAIVCALGYVFCSLVLMCVPRKYACFNRRLYFTERKKEKKLRAKLKERRNELESMRDPCSSYYDGEDEEIDGAVEQKPKKKNKTRLSEMA